jgi:hypothetical protein
VNFGEPRIGHPPKDAWQQSVATDIGVASALLGPDGSFTGGSLTYLGEAIHTLQDYTSPAHTDTNGDPLPWHGIGIGSITHFARESTPERDWAAIGLAVRLTMAAFLEADPTAAEKHGLTKDNFDQQAAQRISDYVSWYYSLPMFDNYRSIVDEEAARACALGNPAACVD